MAVELMMGSYRSDNSFGAAAKMADQESTVEEAASAGLQSVEKLIRMLSQRQQQQQQHVAAAEPEHPNEASMENIDLDCRAVADAAVNKFRKVISLLGRTRTGHARFRRGPATAASPASSVSPPKQSTDHEIFNPSVINTHQNQEEIKMKINNPSSATRVYCPTPIQRYPPLPSHQNHHNHHQNPQFSMNVIHHQQQQKSTSAVCERKESSTTINFTSPSISSTTTSFMSSLTGDTDQMKHQPSSSSGFQITGRPPLSSSSSLKRKCMSSDDAATKCAGRCHCSKRKKSRVMKRVVRVPAISLRMADIPPDDYSWRKYGQKPIKGSPHPRGYYRCSTLKNCPARKHVERALDDPTMLIITYEGEHNHSHSITDAAPLILESS